MRDLLDLTHEHDLPPKWDGHPVQWSTWERDSVFICPPPKPEPCPACGRTGTPFVATRTVAVQGVAHIFGRRSGRTVTPLTLRLRATRCPHCRFDQVWDGERLWDLDYTDYGDEGSTCD